MGFPPNTTFVVVETLESIQTRYLQEEALFQSGSGSVTLFEAPDSKKKENQVKDDGESEATVETKMPFDEMPERNSVSWSVMVGGFGKAGDYMKCFEIFREYVKSGQRLDVYTLPAVIRVCRDKMDVKMGRVIHDIVWRYGQCWNTFICAAIVDMYAKCGVIDDARMMFDGMDEKDLTTWTVVIGAYAACGSANESLVLFDQMQECGIVPDMVTVVNTCGKLGAMNKAKVVHDIVTLVVPLWRLV
ncbi:pentatricopeptide repeat-containing protein [Tanacetum coccineum]